MHQNSLCLTRYTARPTRVHDGKIETIASDVRWCSDGFGIQCWNGEQLQVAFSLDCHDREAITFVTSSRGLDVRTTPSYSPESNGMAEAFVKTFKRDYVWHGDLSSADRVPEQLTGWFEDYNENAPHKALKMQSPRAYRRQLNRAG